MLRSLMRRWQCVGIQFSSSAASVCPIVSRCTNPASALCVCVCVCPSPVQRSPPVARARSSRMRGRFEKQAIIIMTRDVTVPPYTYAESHISSTATKPGAAAHKTAQNKIDKYSKLASTIMPKLQSTYDERLICQTSFEERKVFSRYDSLAKSSETMFVN